MALISTKNILIPFTNRLHLATMILFVAAFAILRLSGGDVTIEKKKDRTTSYTEPQSTEGDFFEKLKQEEQAKESSSASQQKSLDDIEQLFQ